MFLNQLTVAERVPFLALADAFVKCDEVLSESERKVIQCLATEAGVSISEVPVDEDVSALARTFISRSSRICSLLELIGLGHADSDYSTEESRFVRDLAQKWEVSETELAVLENWVLRLLTLMAEAQEIIDRKE